MLHHFRCRGLFIIGQEFNDRKVGDSRDLGKLFLFNCVIVVAASSQREYSKMLIALQVLSQQIGIHCRVIANNTTVHNQLLNTKLVRELLWVEVDWGGTRSSHCLSQQNVVISSVVKLEVL